MLSAIERPPQEVLDCYGASLSAARWEPLGNAGGFSGARLWRAVAEGRAYLLRAWPAGRMTADRLCIIHALMEKAHYHGLTYVPVPELSAASSSWVQCRAQCWELTNWLPGKADFRDNPTDVRLIEAVRAIARIHGVWSQVESRLGRCPAIERRLAAIHDWNELRASGWRPEWNSAGDLVRDYAQHLWDALPAHLLAATTGLRRCQDRAVPLQPCLCDVWHDHILYEADTVTGVIDYGQVKLDCVAVDLARLLGSMIPNAPERMQGALWVYTQMRPLAAAAEDLVPLLDWTGVLVGAMNWLRWLYHERRTYPTAEAVAQRLRHLVQRLETVSPGARLPQA
jgi:Ser/Thr protein kinase RdoA (MazF antagonist)